MEEKILKKLREQEQVLLKLRESLERRLINRNENRTWLHERAKLIGIMDVCDVMGIDRSEFNWIF